MNSAEDAGWLLSVIKYTLVIAHRQCNIAGSSEIFVLNRPFESVFDRRIDVLEAGYLDVLEACACVCGLETVALRVYMWVYYLACPLNNRRQ